MALPKNRLAGLRLRLRLATEERVIRGRLSRRGVSENARLVIRRVYAGRLLLLLRLLWCRRRASQPTTTSEQGTEIRRHWELNILVTLSFKTRTMNHREDPRRASEVSVYRYVLGCIFFFSRGQQESKKKEHDLAFEPKRFKNQEIVLTRVTRRDYLVYDNQTLVMSRPPGFIDAPMASIVFTESYTLPGH